MDCILIDDDTLVHLSWKLAARASCRNMEAFLDPQHFYLRAHEFDKKVPVYIDRNLGKGLLGEDVCRRVHDLGFTEIYLATGSPSFSPQGVPFLKGIVGKNPPFLQEK